MGGRDGAGPSLLSATLQTKHERLDPTSSSSDPLSKPFFAVPELILGQLLHLPVKPRSINMDSDESGTRWEIFTPTPSPKHSSPIFPTPPISHEQDLSGGSGKHGSQSGLPDLKSRLGVPSAFANFWFWRLGDEWQPR